MTLETKVSELDTADLFEIYLQGRLALGIMLDSEACIAGFFSGHPNGGHMTWDFMQPTDPCRNLGSGWVASELEVGGSVPCDGRAHLFTAERLLAFCFTGSISSGEPEYIFNRLNRSRIEHLPPYATQVANWGIWLNLGSHIKHPSRPLFATDHIKAH